MERYIGMDVHAASCTLAVISQTGKRLKDFPVETNGQALVEAVRTPRICVTPATTISSTCGLNVSYSQAL